MCFGRVLSPVLPMLNPAKAINPLAPVDALVGAKTAKKIDPLGAQMDKTLASQDSTTQTLLTGGGSNVENKAKTLLGT